MNKKASFEEAVDDQIRQIHENDQENPEAPVELSEKDQYRILMGEGIEFKAGDLNLIIPPFKIKEIKILNSMTDLMLNPKIDEIKVLDEIIGLLSKVLKVDKETLEENLYKEDLETIIGLCTFSIIKGKDMFKKKSITAREMEAVTGYMQVMDKKGKA